ncbi:hypothetical protein HGM15179_018072 [Zosterops borbonicus]|uniref:Ras-related protein Rab-13 n=1 Tax=Zosterops borbonicus TaxID=364589 RepID=A0A8K1LCL6_9PASS|nr:hypothetical protein HGM15179_018072 [Zosterops borbonicus]
MAKAYDHLFKLLLIGDSGVGKTCLVIRFAEDNFSSTYISTIGIDFKIRTVDIDGKKIKLQVWDTAGQERFKTITTAYYRGAVGIVLVYDITDEKSFENIQNWMKSIKENASAGVERLLLGNKCDMEGRRKVQREAAEKLAREHGIRFFETSAKSSQNVEEAFHTLARDILHKSFRKAKTIPACGPTGFIERINCASSQRDEYKSCRSAALESQRFWRFVGSALAVAAAAAALVVLRQRVLDRRALEKVRKQIESI